MSSRELFSLLVMALIFVSVSNYALAERPDWVMNPDKGDGYAASACTSDTGNASLDRQMAVAMARGELAKQIEVKVETLDEIVQSKTEDDALRIEFTSTSRQIASQSLKKSIPSKIESVDNNGKPEVCVLLHLDQKASGEMFRSIVKAMPVSLSVEEEDALFGS